MTEEFTHIPGGLIQIILRSEHRREVEASMARQNARVEGGGGLLSWIGPIKTKSNTWTAVGRGPVYLQHPESTSCADEQGNFELENCPDVYGDTKEKL